MPEYKYLVRVGRDPKPGYAFKVLDDVLEHRRSIGLTIGSVTATVFSTVTRVVSSIPFESMVDMEQMVDQVYDDEARRNSQDELAKHCSNYMVIVSRIVEPPEGIDDAKYLRRLVFNHGTRSRSQLVDALLQMNDQIDGPRWGIDVSLNGSMLIATQAMQSLETVDRFVDAMNSDRTTRTLAGAALNLSESWSSSIVRVYRS